MPTITAQRDKLLPVLGCAQKALERRSTIPILQNMLLEASAGRLTVTATDLDVEVTSGIDATADSDFAFTLPGATLHDTVRKLPEGCELRLSAEKDFCTITAGRSRFRLPVLPADDYPHLSAVQPTHAFALDAKLLERLLATLSFAISTEETRYYLNGIYLHAKGDQLVAVATDGHRLAKLALPLPEGAAGMPGIILPRRTVQLLRALLPDAGTVEIGLTDAMVRLTADAMPVVKSKLIDGTYPDYDRVVPAGNANRFRLDRAALVDAIDRVGTISSERGRAVRCGFAESALTLSMSNPENGSAEEEVPLVLAEGQPVETGFNGKYCLDMLAAAGCEAIEAQLGDPGNPALFQPLDGPDPRPLFVIMPMRV